jgi:hypothetical protein
MPARSLTGACAPGDDEWEALMVVRRAWGIGVASAVCVMLGAAALAYGHAESPAGRTAAHATPRAGDSYTFVDRDLSRDEQILTYALPKLPAGAYSVSLFAGLEPTDGTFNENLYCQVSDTTRRHRILVATTRWIGEAATFVSGSSATRVRDNSHLQVLCEAEHGPLRYQGDPLRVTFVRLASLTSTAIEPSP